LSFEARFSPGLFLYLFLNNHFQKKKENRKKKKESLSAGGQLRCQGFCDIFYTSEIETNIKNIAKPAGLTLTPKSCPPNFAFLFDFVVQVCLLYILIKNIL